MFDSGLFVKRKLQLKDEGDCLFAPGTRIHFTGCEQ